MDATTFFKLNWWATLKINFSVFSFSEAIKLPVMVFGKLLITDLSGKIIINCPSKRGILRIGQDKEMDKTTANIAQLDLAGNLIINGQVEIEKDVRLIIKKGASFTIGEGSYLGKRTRLFITQDTHFGKYVVFSYDSQLSTTHFHYMMNMETGKVKRLNIEGVHIGDYCWIGNSCTIMPGTIIPSNTIIASNSLANKDFSSLQPHSIIGGIPARFIKSGVSRVYNPKTEESINKYFESHPNENELNISHLDIF